MGKPCEFFFKSSVQTNGLHRLLGVLGDDDEMDALCGYMLKNRAANGVRQTYEYDGRGQLLAVKNADGSDAERYAYDKAGNMVRKTVGGKTTTFTFDGANQLVSSTTDGVTTKYAYDAAGRLVKEGTKAYRYGYLDKVLSVTDGKSKFTYDYHVDGQLASADYGGGKSEDFEWDGLALVQRGGERFINEPHIGGGNPVFSSKGTSYFNDMLGTTLGSRAKGKKYSAAALTAFGERLDNADNTSPAIRSLGEGWFTGKPYVEGLGHTFLFRNYRAGLAKWQTADPLGYPDGWNRLAYCGNRLAFSVDLYGAVTITICSSAEGEASSFNESGHAWIVITDDNGNQTTYGTWGNNPNGQGNGLHENLEKGRDSDASRTITITQDQKDIFDGIIEEYRNKGADAWSATDPCSDFAADVWNKVTGEDPSSWWIWDTPSDLKDAIINMNGNVKHKVVE